MKKYLMGHILDSLLIEDYNPHRDINSLPVTNTS